MPHKPHSPTWYAQLAHELGDYKHPWKRHLQGPDPELGFDLILNSLLTPKTHVLEAGCGHGPDAKRFGQQAASWTAYDRQPELLQLAQTNAPKAKFHLWDSKGQTPKPLTGPFDLIVSRRGPTSVILQLPYLASTNAHFLYVGPRLVVPQVPERLAQIGWQIFSEWKVSVLAYAPTWQDWQTRCESMQEDCKEEDWHALSTIQGMPYQEERHIILASPPT